MADQSSCLPPSRQAPDSATQYRSEVLADDAARHGIAFAYAAEIEGLNRLLPEVYQDKPVLALPAV